jgi:hypothetical protein
MERTWSEWASKTVSTAGEYVSQIAQNPYVEGLVEGLVEGAVVGGLAVAAIASRGKLLGVVENLFPKASELLEAPVVTALKSAGSGEVAKEVEAAASDLSAPSATLAKALKSFDPEKAFYVSPMHSAERMIHAKTSSYDAGKLFPGSAKGSAVRNAAYRYLMHMKGVENYHVSMAKDMRTLESHRPGSLAELDELVFGPDIYAKNALH